MDTLYPAGPAAAPTGLTRPSVAYRRHAWLAVGALLAFVALYLFLTVYFISTTWRLFGALSKPGLGGLAAFPCAFLSVFLIKGFFFVRRGQANLDFEVTARAQPRLFAFLHRLADETGAPRPHRVVLTPEVNAAVFYDLSLLNFFLPSRKNLVIGLALVNTLTLGEMKAVLAHEFGHFAQRSMAVGNWVYIARQVAGAVVAQRDWLDRVLVVLSRVDIRVAWIGWGMSVIVWSLRSLVDSVFRGVLLAQRALSREMEFQADLVAVSVTGSDALVHALHRLNVADDAWERTQAFARGEANGGRLVHDVFAVHTRMMERLRHVLDKPDHGIPPPLPAEAPGAHRVFRAAMANPPRMWASHPPNVDREENAKRTYVPAPLDERSAWVLFDDAEALRARMSAHLMPKVDQGGLVPLEDTFARLDERFGRPHLDPRYRGVYLGRGVTRGFATAEAMAEPPASPEPAAVLAALEAQYPPSLSEVKARLDTLREEKAALEAVESGHLEPTGGVLRHRGHEISRRRLPEVIAEVAHEVEAAERDLDAQAHACRSAHLAAAALVGPTWVASLRGLHGLLHHLEHVEADLADVFGMFGNVWAVVTADGRVSGAERKRLHRAAVEVHAVIVDVYDRAGEVRLEPELCRRLEIQSHAAALGTRNLPAPQADNLAQWLEHFESYVVGAGGYLGSLRAATLNLLLERESAVAAALRDATPLEDAPAPVSAPRHAFLRGQERPRQKRLDLWDRFQTADGPAAAGARLVVAGGIVGGVLFGTSHVGEARLTVYNGLGIPVHVRVGDRNLNLPPRTVKAIRLDGGAARVVASTADEREIESFDVELGQTFEQFVYNVAGAGAFVQATAVYGNARSAPPEVVGSARWFETQVDHVLEDPPTSVQISGGGATRTVLLAADPLRPQLMLQAAGDAERAGAVLAAHVRWDGANDPSLAGWLRLVPGAAEARAALAAHLADAPDDVLLRRAEWEAAADADERAALCAAHVARAAERPDDGDWQYLALRCSTADDPVAGDARATALRARFPDNPWLLRVEGWRLASHGEWTAARDTLDAVARRMPGLAVVDAADRARVRRMAAGDEGVGVADLVVADPGLRVQLLAVDEKDADAQLAALRDLARGQLDTPIGETQLGAEASEYLQVLVGCSDGAPPAAVTRALGVRTPPSSSTGLFVAALALRTPGAAVADGLLPPLKPFMDALAARDVPRAEAALDGLDPYFRGLACAAGLIALQDEAPAAWRTAARLLLLPAERPFFAANP